MKKVKKSRWQQWVRMACFAIAGFAGGYLIAKYMIPQNAARRTIPEIIGRLLVILAGMYAAVFVQLILHEAGHLVFGLLSGYRFCSFRIMSFMWVKENGKLKFKRLSLAGTGGQCLMGPPELVEGKIPVILYNLGGSIMNLTASAVFFFLFLLCGKVPFLSVFLLAGVIIGIVFAGLNGIPMHMGAVDNDGYNARSLGRNAQALRSFWVQMKANEETAKGIRLKDMPDQWFAVPSDEEMKNSMTAVMGVFACCRFMDEHRFQEANALMKHLLEIPSGMVDLHRRLMICDRICCELFDGSRESASALLTKEQKNFMKVMKKYPSVVRTEYVCALLCEKDQDKARTCKEAFEKYGRIYPYPSDVQSERELMDIADDLIGNLPCTNPNL